MNFDYPKPVENTSFSVETALTHETTHKFHP